MHRGWFVAALFVAGCFGKPDFSGGPSDARTDATKDGDTTGDGPMPDAPCTGAWGSPQTLGGLSGEVTGEPTITGDLKTLYASYQVDSTHWEIHWASRNSVADGFTPRGRWALDPGSDDSQDPSVTDDGKLLVFLAGTGNVLKQAEDDGTGTMVLGDVPGLAGITPSTINISGDGKTLYYNLGSVMHIAKRALRTDPFVEQAGTFGDGLLWPAVTGDGLHIFYTMQPSTYGIYEGTRGSTGDAFSGATMLLGSGYHDPDVTSDGATLIVGVRAGTTAAILRRMCQ